MIVTSGGVSVGDADFVKPAVEAEGALLMWRIAMKPGRPLAFGRVGECGLHRLPGNPVSSFVTFLIFVRPFLLKTQGVIDVAPRAIQARADFDWPEPDPRREFLRVKWNARGRAGPLSDAGFGGADVHGVGRRPGRQPGRAGRSARATGALPAVFGAVSVKVKVLYFAGLREQLGRAARRSSCRPAWHGRGAAQPAARPRRRLADALAEGRLLRVAVNQDMAQPRPRSRRATRSRSFRR